MDYSFDRIDYSDGIGKKNHNHRKNYKKLEPFICKGCNRVWQPMREASQISDYLIGFPKYGCTIKLCINCKRKEKNNGTNEEN